MTKRFLSPLSTDHVDLNKIHPSTQAEARVLWDDGDGTISVGLKGGNVNLSIGQEEVVRVYNGTGSTLTDGQVVYITGAQGQRPSVALAKADSESTSAYVLGVVTEPITNGSEGFVTTFGVVRGINTLGYTEGAAIWLSASTAGAFTSTKPTAPNHLVQIGFVVKAHQTAGQIFVRNQNGYEIDELHDVSITSKTDNDVLSYDSTAGYWKNQNLATAISEVDGSGSGIDADKLDGQEGSYYAADSTVVHIDGTETITGTKTFRSTGDGSGGAQIGTANWDSELKLYGLTQHHWAIRNNDGVLRIGIADGDGLGAAITDSMSITSGSPNVISVSGGINVSGTAQAEIVDLNEAQITAKLNTISVTTAVLIDSFVSANYRGSEYTFQFSTNGTDFTITKVIMIHNGTDVAISEYGHVEIGNPIPYDFNGSFSGGNLELTVTCSTANLSPVDIKFTRTLIDS